MNNYCTPIPARRISTNSRLELRVATDSAAILRAEIVTADGERRHAGHFSLKGGVELPKIYPTVSGAGG